MAYQQQQTERDVGYTCPGYMDTYDAGVGGGDGPYGRDMSSSCEEGAAWQVATSLILFTIATIASERGRIFFNKKEGVETIVSPKEMSKGNHNRYRTSLIATALSPGTALLFPSALPFVYKRTRPPSSAAARR